MLNVEWIPKLGKFRLEKGGVYFFLTREEIAQLTIHLRRVEIE